MTAPDLAGNARQHDDPGVIDRGAGQAPIIDLGAYEFQGTSPDRCASSDFNGDGDIGTDADIQAFFACVSGDCCETCDPRGADFNGDGDRGTDADLETFFRVLAGGPC